MSKIFVDGDCSVCSAYGNFLNKRNTNVSVSSQLDLNKEDIEKDQIVYIKNEKKFYASNAIIESIADLGGLYKIIKILYFFPKVITDCCRYHVAAKRYLCATNPEYFQKLSAASVHSLNLQGGPMSKTEIKEFERNPNLKKILTVRLYDDAGKIPDMDTPSFWHFAPLVQKMVDSHCSRENN